MSAHFTAHGKVTKISLILTTLAIFLRIFINSSQSTGVSGELYLISSFEI